MQPFELITTGRVGVDLYPQQIGVPLAEVETFAKYLGGTATNVAVQAALLGSRTAVVTKVGDDGFGSYVRTALERFGVDPRWVGTDPELRTPIVFCEVHPPEHFPLLFYRQPKAPDMNLTIEDFDVEAVLGAALFWITGTGLSEEPSRSTLLDLIARRAPAPTALDLDYRPTFWRSREHACRWIQHALGFVTIAVGNTEEAEVAVGEREPHAAAAALLDRGVELAVIKRGSEGVLASGDPPGGAQWSGCGRRVRGNTCAWRDPRLRARTGARARQCRRGDRSVPARLCRRVRRPSGARSARTGARACLS